MSQEDCDRREFVLMYKCRLCNKVYDGGGRVSLIDRHMAAITLDMEPFAAHIIPHSCDDTSMRGIADLQGARTYE